MAIEKEKRVYNHVSKKGLRSLAQLEIKWAERAEKNKDEGYKLKVARLVTDLDRILNVCSDNNIDLEDDVIHKIDKLIFSHPNRRNIIKENIHSNY